MTWWYISAPHATFALAMQEGAVVRAAPLAAWTLGKQQRVVLAYWRRRGAVVVRMEGEL